MTENKESRIKVDDLAEPEKELTAEEAKSVKGGVFSELAGISSFKSADGSVKPGAQAPPDPVKFKPGV